jgi:hypothetical protein
MRSSVPEIAKAGHHKLEVTGYFLEAFWAFRTRKVELDC